MEALEGIQPSELETQEVNVPAFDRRMKLKAALAASTLLLAGCMASSSAPNKAYDETSDTSTSRVDRPNIVLVETDDESMNLMPYMPYIRHYYKKHGVEFTNSFVAQSLCCSSRASKFTGMVPHNDHVLTNNNPDGGFWPFHVYDEKSTFPVWLQKNGYSTSFMGKFMNQFPNEPGVNRHWVPDDYIPDGFSEFTTPVGGKPYNERNYRLNVNGVVDEHLRRTYMVRVLDRMGRDFIERQADSPTSFSLEIDPYAPHAPYRDEKRFRGKYFDSIDYPRTEAFNEKNIDDKTNLLRLLPRLSGYDKQLINHDFRKRIGAVMGVDRMFKHIIQTLRETGQLSNAYVIFTSDNGYHMGEHRMGIGKNTPYDTDIRVPLYVSGPGIKPGRLIQRLVGNIDLAPTISDMAGVKPPKNVDGKSFLPLLESKLRHPWRKYFLTERGPDEYYVKNSDSIQEPADPIDVVNARYQTEPYVGVRWVGKQPGLYMEYNDGTREYYDLATDPDEDRNLLAAGTTMTASQNRQLEKAKIALAQLKHCQGNTGPSTCFMTREGAEQLLANR